MHRAHRAENHSLRLSLSPFSGLSSFLPWLAPSCYKKVFLSTVSSSQGPFQPTGQEAHSDFKGVLSAAASMSAWVGRTEARGGWWHGEALGSQGTGHRRSFCSKHSPCLQPPSKPQPALLCCQAISSHHLQPKEMDKPSACPTLCSWKAGSCSPGSPELPLTQLQAPPSLQCRHHRCRSRLSTSFCTSSLPVLPTDP